jgi:hypothetical protein
MKKEISIRFKNVNTQKALVIDCPLDANGNVVLTASRLANVCDIVKAERPEIYCYLNEIEIAVGEDYVGHLNNGARTIYISEIKQDLMAAII